MNTNKLWIVNGIAHKVEGNFTSKAFDCTEIGHHGIYIGDYPQEEDDFEKLLSKGIKTVINVMSDDLLFKEVLAGIKNPVMEIANGNLIVDQDVKFLQLLMSFRP